MDAAVLTGEEVRAAIELGPKLQNILTALGLTAAGRSDKKTSGGEPQHAVPNTGPATTPGDELARLRAERQAVRVNGA
jgi:hypothetical protein